jgi:uncharacterized protein
MGRASYAKDNTRRVLLQPGKKTILPFINTYMTSRKLGKGSRIVILLNINKSQHEQINYGTGKEVSDETIRDAATPLLVKWFGGSCIKIPVWRDGQGRGLR